MPAHQAGPRQAVPPAHQREPGRNGAVAPARPTGPAYGRTAGLLALQRRAGNAAVTRLITAQRYASADRHSREGAGAALRGSVQAALRSPGQPLQPLVRADMETKLGADFSDVRVHTGASADRASQAVAAHAFTTGSHLVFRNGGYSPATPAGRRVLAHELVHVLQQRRGPVAGSGGPVRISDPADRFERAAEATSRRVTDGGMPTAHGSLSLPQAGGRAVGGHSHLPVQRHSLFGSTHNNNLTATTPAITTADISFGPRYQDSGTYTGKE